MQLMQLNNPHNRYISAQRFANGVYELLTTPSFKDFVANERASKIIRQANLYCLGSSEVVQVTFNIRVRDLNNQPVSYLRMHRWR